MQVKERKKVKIENHSAIQPGFLEGTDSRNTDKRGAYTD